MNWIVVSRPGSRVVVFREELEATLSIVDNDLIIVYEDETFERLWSPEEESE